MSIIDRLKKTFSRSVALKKSQLEAQRNEIDPIKENNKILFDEIVGDFRFMQQLDELITYFYHESKKLELEGPYKCKYEEDDWVTDKRLLLRFYKGEYDRETYLAVKTDNPKEKEIIVENSMERKEFFFKRNEIEEAKQKFLEQITESMSK